MTIGYKLLADLVQDGSKIHTMRGACNRIPSPGTPVKEFRILSTYHRTLIRMDRRVKSIQVMKMKLDESGMVRIWMDNRELDWEQVLSLIWFEGYRCQTGADIRAFCAFFALDYPGNFWHGILVHFTSHRY